MPPRLDISNLRKTFGQTTAVKNLSLQIAAGEFVSLLGASGCGKSTTLAMIAGFLEPDAGTINVDRQKVNGLPPERRRIGIVFQDYAVFSRLTVESNLLFGLEAQKVPRVERAARIRDIARQLELQPLLGRRGGSLNMSEMQRVALGRAMVTQPKLLLLDEPMSNLDAALRASLRSELRRIQRQQQQSVLYVTHDQVEAMAMSDRIAIMRDGEILQAGTPDEIYHHPVHRHVAEFIGDPPINILNCEIARRGEMISASTPVEAAIPLGHGGPKEGRYLLAVRPHDIVVSRKPGAIAGTVRLVEHLGAEDVIHVSYGNDLVTAISKHAAYGIGDKISLAVKPAKAHLIDGSSGAVVPLERERVAA